MTTPLIRRYFIRIAILSMPIFLYACQQASSKSTGEHLPAFNILLLDSTTKFNTSSIAEGHPSVLLYFSPDCEHCQRETEGIIKNMDSLKNVQFYFITNDPFDRMQVYNKMYHLDKYPNITMGRDYSFFFPAHFKDVSPPYMVIYDQYKNQSTIFHGETATRQIIAHINTL